ncbi:hypothetical protein [Bradyrhizobium sp. BR 1432]|uniref:hypothetical protein n=1 Tax=Bradyrhizobium sp. BR 1432 TaxID=3447966 RepID=UPI003EE75463
MTDALITHSGIKYKSVKPYRGPLWLNGISRLRYQNGVMAMMPCGAIAVDPSFQIEQPVISGKRVLAVTSDRFLAGYIDALPNIFQVVAIVRSDL